MKKVLMILLVCLVTFVAGCTLTETPSQRNRRIQLIADLEWRMAVDDLDYLLLIERSTRMTYYNTRVGN